jgi:hypothetical protein
MPNALLNHRSRNASRILRSWCLIPGILFAVARLAYSSVHPVVENPQALVRQVVENEIDARSQDTSYWRYILQAQEADESRTEIVVETQHGTLKHLLSQNGLPASPRQIRQEDQRIWDLVHNPHELEKQASEQEWDWQKAQRLLKLLPDGFLYTCESEEGQTIRLSFRPNPNFDPPTFEAKIFHVFQGIMLVDSGQKRLVEMRGWLSCDLEFGWGIFGKLRKGGTLELRQEQVEPRHWEMTFLSIHITGRAWFFKTIGKQRQESRRAFQRVPERTTLEEATEMVKRCAQELMHVKPPSS